MDSIHKKCEDFSEKRRINKLRNEVRDARLRWEEIVQENMIKKYASKGNSDRSPSRIIYFSRSGEWSDEVKMEMKKLQAKITGLRYSGTKKPRAFWLPTVIETASKIEVGIYQAVSTRTVDAHQAKSFALKAGFKGKICKSNHYVIRAITGRSYKLRCSNEKGVYSESFTDWVVCLCNEHSSIPIVLENDLLSRSNFEFKDALCTCKNSALYSERQDNNEWLDDDVDDDVDDEWLDDD